MDLLRYTRSVRRHWRLLLVTTLLGLAAGIGSGRIQKAAPESSWYRAEHTLVCSAGAGNLTQLSAFTTTGPVPEQAAERLGGNAALLAEQVRTRVVPEAAMLQIVAVDTDPTRAVQLADTFAEELEAYELQLPDASADQKIQDLRAEQETQRKAWNQALENGTNAANLEEAEHWKQQHDEAIQRYDELEAEIKDLQTGGNRQACLKTVSTAQAIPSTREAVNEILSTPQAGRSSKTATATTGSILPEAAAPAQNLGTVPRAGAGAFAGFLLGIALALLIDRLDPRVRTKEQAEDAFGWPVVSEIPPLSRSQRKEDSVTTHDQPRSRIAEAYRVLRSSILFAADIPESFPGAAALGAAGPGSAPNGNGTAVGEGSRTGTGNGNGNGAGNGSPTPTRRRRGTKGDPAREQAPVDEVATIEASRDEPTGHKTERSDDKPTKASDDKATKASDDTASTRDAGAAGTASKRDEATEPPITRDAVVVMVTSPGPSEGKTTTVANLAVAFAEAGAKVLVVNCDFRRPRVRNYIGGDEQQAARGPTPTTLDRIDLFDHHTDSIDESPAEILAEQRRMIRRSRTRYDVILLDTAPLLSTNDATEVLGEADLVVLVGRVGKTTKEAADRSAELLDRREAPVLGVVLVGATDGPGGRYYYYGSNRYYSDETRRDAERRGSPLEEIAAADAPR